MKQIFAPGCALMLYKPDLAAKIQSLLSEHLGVRDELSTCCHHDPVFTEPTEVINVCPGCDKRYSRDFQNTSTISLWELLAASDFFPFPDYHGQFMSILDACPTREKEKVHAAVRKLLSKMNISLIEPEKTGTKSTCCGDSFYGLIPVDQVKLQMKKRAAEMPQEEVVVYCVSCVKSMHIGSKKPRYLIDLLFNENTDPQISEPEEWHGMIDRYIELH